MLLCLLGSFTLLGRYLDPLLMLKLSTLTSWQSFNDLRMQSRKEQKFAYDPTVVNNIWRVFTRFAEEVFAQYELTFVVKDLDFLFLNLFQCDQIWRSFATLEFFWRLWQIFKSQFSIWQNFVPNFKCDWANFLCCSWTNIEKVI